MKYNHRPTVLYRCLPLPAEIVCFQENMIIEAKAISDQKTVRNNLSRIEEHNQRIQSDVKTYGWHCLSIGITPADHDFSYSIGFIENYNHPEVVVRGLSADLTYKILHQCAMMLRQGKRLDVGKRFVGFGNAGQDAYFTLLNAEQKTHFMGTAKYYYGQRDIDVLMLTWSDQTVYLA